MVMDKVNESARKDRLQLKAAQDMNKISLTLEKEFEEERCRFRVKMAEKDAKNTSLAKKLGEVKGQIVLKNDVIQDLIERLNGCEARIAQQDERIEFLETELTKYI